MRALGDVGGARAAVRRAGGGVEGRRAALQRQRFVVCSAGPARAPPTRDAVGGLFEVSRGVRSSLTPSCRRGSISGVRRASQMHHTSYFSARSPISSQAPDRAFSSAMITQSSPMYHVDSSTSIGAANRSTCNKGDAPCFTINAFRLMDMFKSLLYKIYKIFFS